jgi:ribonuclease HII
MDGNCNFGVQGITTMIKADAKVPEVSAASILAKVSRDRYMCEIASRYPLYEFEKHKGYGSALHVEKIKAFGYCEIHRKSFKLKSLSQPSLF